MSDNLLLLLFLVLGGLCLSISAGFLKDWLRKVFQKPKQIGIIGAILFLSGAIITTLVNSQRDKRLKNNVRPREQVDSLDTDNNSSKSYSKSCLFTKNSSASYGLKGQVALVRIQKFAAVIASRQIQKTGISEHSGTDDNSVLKFDNRGIITEALFYNDTTNILERKEVYKYNDAGCPVMTEIYTNGDLDWKEKIQYDYSKSEITFIHLDKNDNYQGMYKSKMCEYGEEETTYYDKKNLIDVREVYLYNEKGEKTITLLYSADGELLRSDTIKYDYLINSVTSIRNGFADRTIVVETRDKHNLTIQEYATNTVFGFQYKKIFTYEFDNIGNWVKKNEFKNGELVSTTERSIEYH